MTVATALSILIPAVGLVAVLAVPGEPRWGRRLSLIASPPRRATLAELFVLLFMLALIRAATQ